MSELSITIVEGYHYTGDGLDLSGTDFWGLALDQRAFGPRRLVVVTARSDGALPDPAPAWPTARVPNCPSPPSSAA